MILPAWVTIRDVVHAQPACLTLALQAIRCIAGGTGCLPWDGWVKVAIILRLLGEMGTYCEADAGVLVHSLEHGCSAAALFLLPAFK
jgi:hypothetical protein